MDSMWDTVFHRMVSRLIRSGQLRITLPDGQTQEYGSAAGPAADLQVAMTIRDGAVLRALCLNPDLALGEGYMNGQIVIENDDLEGLIRLVLRNLNDDALPAWVRLTDRLRYAARHLLHRNNAASARRNVAHHYDISDDLYRLFLDQDMQYSCAYFRDPEMTLEQAQAAKKAHIAAKLQIEPGMRVLDIGCGWGGMALTLARDHGAHVTGLTLSQNQLATAQARARDAGLQDRTDFRLLDYRLIEDRFDRVVSVGMLEHVGTPHYGEYFSKLHDVLEPDGVALIHTIGRTCPPTSQSPWIVKYIFPGGYIPALSQLAPAIEKSGLWTLDIEVWRLHYAMTLRHWRDRFEAALDQVRMMYDDRFIRMWRYYLTACILAFEEQDQAVFHFQLGKTRDAVPLTRDYLHTLPEAKRSRAAG